MADHCRPTYFLVTILVLASTRQVAAERMLLSACPPQSCPSGYGLVQDGSSSCGYFCWTPAKLNCPMSIGGAYVCGGTTGKACPSIACAYTSTYAISGASGCASAQSTIDLLAYSNTTFNVAATLMQGVVKDCCGGSQAMNLSDAASQAAKAYAIVIAKTISHYSLYVCSCCIGQSSAYPAVASSVQSIGTAETNGVRALLSSTSACFGRLLSAATTYASAFTPDLQSAINTIYNSVSSSSGDSCSSTGLTTDITTAVAQSAVCSFANIFAAAIDGRVARPSYACGTKVPVYGVGTVTSCAITINCPR